MQRKTGSRAVRASTRYGSATQPLCHPSRERSACALQPSCSGPRGARVRATRDAAASGIDCGNFFRAAARRLPRRRSPRCHHPFAPHRRTPPAQRRRQRRAAWSGPATTRPASAASAAAMPSSIATAPAGASARPANCGESRPSPCRRPMRRSGSARSPTATCRRPGAMRAAASNIAITPSGGSPAMPTSSSAWSSSARRCRASGCASRPTLPRRSAPGRVATRCWRRSCACSTRRSVRIGNDEYARANKSFGLTTLRNRHAAISGSRLRLRFRGKSGVERDVDLDDPRVAARRSALPGHARPAAVPVRRRKRGRPRRRFGRRQRLHPRRRATPPSRPRTFAPGTAAPTRSSSASRNAAPTRPAGAAPTSCSPMSPGASAIPSPSARSRTCIRACSRPWPRRRTRRRLARRPPTRRAGLSAAERRLLQFLSRGK